MSYTGRKESGTKLYHVMARGINKECVFGQTREKNYFKRIIKKYLEKYGIEIYAYCIMPTHAHLLIKADITELSAFMARILANYAEYYNYKHGRNGHVFQNRFKSECVGNEGYFWTCLRYIHLNPVKAKLAKDVTNYAFSSMKEYRKEENSILHENAIKKYREKFTGFNHFMIYHKERQTHIFLDTKDDISFQQHSAAVLLAEHMRIQYELETQEEVFEEQEIVGTYKKALQEVLNISKRKSEELYVYCRKLMVGV